MNELAHLAVNVMGWRKAEGSPYTRPFWVDGEGMIMAVHEEEHGLHPTWNPRENIDQAFMLLHNLNLESLCFRWLITNHADGYKCCLASPVSSGWDFIIERRKVNDAIVDAVLKASGYQPIKQEGE